MKISVEYCAANDKISRGAAACVLYSYRQSMSGLRDVGYWPTASVGLRTVYPVTALCCSVQLVNAVPTLRSLGLCGKDWGVGKAYCRAEQTYLQNQAKGLHNGHKMTLAVPVCSLLSSLSRQSELDPDVLQAFPQLLVRHGPRRAEEQLSCVSLPLHGTCARANAHF